MFFPLSLVVYPLKGLVAVIRGLLVAVFHTARFVLFAPTVARRAGSFYELGVLSAAYAAVLLIFLAVTFIPGGKLYNCYWLRNATFALLSANTFSLLYEIGRATSNKKKDELTAVTAGPTPAEPAPKPADKPDSFESMWEKVRDLEMISEDQAGALYAEVIQLLKEKKIACQEAMGLAQAIHNGAAETIKIQLPEEKS